MFGLLRARSVSKAISARLAPFLRTGRAASAFRADEDPASAMPGRPLPRTLGFLTVLVTLMARHAGGRLPEHALASVQTSVLAAMTGARPELIGEEILLLSSSGDAAFAEGAAAGSAFFASLQSIDASLASRTGGDASRYFAGSDAGSETDAAAAHEHGGHLQALWDRHVTDPLSEGRC